MKNKITLKSLRELIARIRERIKALKRRILKEGIDSSFPKVSVQKLAVAIATFEGFFCEDRKTTAQRNHNPGNLRWSKYQSMRKSGFAYFSNDEIGWKALRYDLSMKCQGKTRTNLTSESTIKDLIYVWAPPSDNNDTKAYVDFIVKKLGITQNYKLKDFELDLNNTC